MYSLIVTLTMPIWLCGDGNMAFGSSLWFRRRKKTKTHFDILDTLTFPRGYVLELQGRRYRQWRLARLHWGPWDGGASRERGPSNNMLSEEQTQMLIEIYYWYYLILLLNLLYCHVGRLLLRVELAHVDVSLGKTLNPKILPWLCLRCVNVCVNVS